MTSRERRVRDGKRDRCVAPRADACSHFRTDTAAVYGLSAPGVAGEGERESGERDVITPLAPYATLTFRTRAPGATPMICLR